MRARSTARASSGLPHRRPCRRQRSPRTRATRSASHRRSRRRRSRRSTSRSSGSSSVLCVIVRALDEAEPFTTADGSTIRELLGLPTAPVRNQSLAEAALTPGQATQRHYHAETEEIYYVVEGSGEMELDGEHRRVSIGDAVLIPPGA